MRENSSEYPLIGLQSERRWMAYMLPAIAGYVDAVGYLCLANIFTSHLSGNTVAFAAFTGHREWIAAARRGFPIPLFLIGIAIGAASTDLARKSGARSRFTRTFVLEIILLTLLTVIGGSVIVSKAHALLDWRFYFGVSLASLAMGMQNGTLRRVAGNTVRTTYVSAIATDMIESIVAIILSKKLDRGDVALRKERAKAALFARIYLSFIGGAVCGGLIQLRFHLHALAVAVLALIWVTILDLRNSPHNTPINR